MTLISETGLTKKLKMNLGTWIWCMNEITDCLEWISSKLQIMEHLK